MSPGRSLDLACRGALRPDARRVHPPDRRVAIRHAILSSAPCGWLLHRRLHRCPADRRVDELDHPTPEPRGSITNAWPSERHSVEQSPQVWPVRAVNRLSDMADLAGCPNCGTVRAVCETRVIKVACWIGVGSKFFPEPHAPQVGGALLTNAGASHAWRSPARFVPVDSRDSPVPRSCVRPNHPTIGRRTMVAGARVPDEGLPMSTLFP